MAFPPGLLGSGKAILPSGVVSFPRGFALAPDGRLFLASGTSPSGDGDDTILAFAPDLTLSAERFVDAQRNGKNSIACPLRRSNLATAPRKRPSPKSKAVWPQLTKCKLPSKTVLSS